MASEPFPATATTAMLSVLLTTNWSPWTNVGWSSTIMTRMVSMGLLRKSDEREADRDGGAAVAGGGEREGTAELLGTFSHRAESHAGAGPGCHACPVVRDHDLQVTVYPGEVHLALGGRAVLGGIVHGLEDDSVRRDLDRRRKGLDVGSRDRPSHQGADSRHRHG